jgi:hydroxyacylglutathione hydrolase
MKVFPVDVSDLGNRSYVVTDGVAAMAIDPPRPPTGVLDIVEAHGLALEMVVETHLHNDHVSGGPELAVLTGATHAVSANENVRGTRGLVNGEQFQVGAMRVDVVGTPGHTRHHQAFAVTEGGRCAVFTGGSLLVGSVGRTDLFGADAAEALAGEQWSSVRGLLENLSRKAVVHPTHGFGSFCSSTPATTTESTIGTERRVNPAALIDRETFVKTLLEGFGEFPSYFAHMAELNRAGFVPPAYRDPAPSLSDGEVADLAAHMWVVDVRHRAGFAAGHIPGTVNIGLDGPFATYLGWTMPWRSEFVLVAGDEAELSRARLALAHIGLDTPVGTAIPDAIALTGRLRRASFDELAAEWTDEIAVIDVRREEEWNTGHLEGAHHLPLHRLPESTLPSGRLWLYCAAGYRAMLGASLLQRSGHDVVAIDGPWSDASEVGLAISTAQPPYRSEP